MFLFHSCNHALTPHFHQFTVLGTRGVEFESAGKQAGRLHATRDGYYTGKNSEQGRQELSTATLDLSNNLCRNKPHNEFYPNQVL